MGIPGGQTIPGLSNFNISGGVGFGDSGIAEFNDIKSYQFTDKYSMFLGRHSLKFGGRWLYQQQGFSYSGNEGILGHFDYTGAFTGFGFADFLLGDVALKGKGGAVSPFTHMQNRVSVYAQDDFRVRDNLTLNLGLSWEYTSPLVEKDDRQSNIDLTTGQLLLAGQNGNSRALYNAYYGGFEPRLGRRLDAVGQVGRARRLRHRAVHGGHGQEPPAAGEPAVQLRRATSLRRDDWRRDRPDLDSAT